MALVRRIERRGVSLSTKPYGSSLAGGHVLVVAVMASLVLHFAALVTCGLTLVLANGETKLGEAPRQVSVSLRAAKNVEFGEAWSLPAVVARGLPREEVKVSPETTSTATEERGPSFVGGGLMDRDPQRYYPRAELSEPPVPISPVDVPWPEGIQISERLAVLFQIGIDENGIVRWVRPGNPGVAVEVQEVVQSAFFRSLFDPGRLQGQPVKAMMTIEVVLDPFVSISEPAPQAYRQG